MYYWPKYKVVQQLWITAWQYLGNVRMCTPQRLQFYRLSIHPTDMCSTGHMCDILPAEVFSAVHVTGGAEDAGRCEGVGMFSLLPWMTVTTLLRFISGCFRAHRWGFGEVTGSSGHDTQQWIIL